MGRFLLIGRLAARDLRRRPAEALLLLLSISAATVTLTMGLVLQGVTGQPYQTTRAATAGPDAVVFSSSRAQVESLAHAPGVVGHAGPYALPPVMLRVRGKNVPAEAEGRDLRPTPIDQPKVTQGRWIRDGAVVIERSFADALGVHAGESITVNGRSFQVAGTAVTAANPAYPMASPGQIWLTRADSLSLPTADRPAFPTMFRLDLRLADPAAARAFATAHSTLGLAVMAWQDIGDQDATLVTNARQDLLIGGWLLGLLAAASVAVLVGGRMAEQTRRVGLLKAVGGTPALIAAVLLTEHVTLALIAAAIGLAVGLMAAPMLTDPGAGLVGVPGAPSLTVVTVALVVAAALTVAVGATLVPAIRAARTTTIDALADSAHPPRRRARLVAVSARLPVPLLLGLRLAARRPRRAVLAAASIMITVTAIVAVLTFRQRTSGLLGPSGLDNPQTDRDNQVLLVVTIVLVALAAINAIFIAWATVLDTRRPSALTRALGATLNEVSTGLSVAQLLPALPAVLLGIPAGIGLYAAAANGTTLTIPPVWALLAVIPATLLTMAGLTAVPARIGTRRSIAEILHSE